MVLFSLKFATSKVEFLRVCSDPTLAWSLQIPAPLGFPYLENDFYTLGRIVLPRLITDTAPVTGIKDQESIQTLSPPHP
jgi:hypothetical protein